MERIETNSRSRAENCVHVLRGLISYHERMTMGNYQERDFYLDALRYALSLAENEIMDDQTSRTETVYLPDGLMKYIDRVANDHDIAFSNALKIILLSHTKLFPTRVPDWLIVIFLFMVTVFAAIVIFGVL